MNTLRNQVQLIGRLGADAEIKLTSKGKSYAQLRMATNEYVKTSGGEWKDITQWHTLVVWGDLTKVLESHGKKGSQLLVSGSLQYREYTDANQVKRTIAEVNVRQIMPFQNVVKAKVEDGSGVADNLQEADLPF